MPDELHDPQLGISIRFIRAWSLDESQRITAEDIFRLRDYMERRSLERQFALPSPPEHK